MMQLADIVPRDIDHLPVAKDRQDDAVEQAPIFGCRADLALRLGVLGEEALGEIRYGRGFLSGDLVGSGIGAALDHAKQPFCLPASLFGRPWRPMLANGQLPKRRSPAAADAVMDDVRLGATTLDPDAEAFDLGIPEHRLGT